MLRKFFKVEDAEKAGIRNDVQLNNAIIKYDRGMLVSFWRVNRHIIFLVIYSHTFNEEDKSIRSKHKRKPN